MTTKVPHLNLGALWVSLLLISVSQAYFVSEISEDSDYQIQDSKRGADQCKGITCRDPPEGDCKKVSSGKGGLFDCCPDYECKDPDGTVSKLSGIAGSGSEGKEYSYNLPGGKGHVKTSSSSSFSSSSSSSSGPSAFKHVEPMKFDHPQMMGPPPGFFKPMVMPTFAPMKPMQMHRFGSQR